MATWLMVVTSLTLQLRAEYVVKCKSCNWKSHFRIREFAPRVPVYMLAASGEYQMMMLEQLLPKSFGPEDVSRKK